MSSCADNSYLYPSHDANDLACVLVGGKDWTGSNQAGQRRIVQLFTPIRAIDEDAQRGA